jgi:flagellar FliL protein
MAEVNEVNFSKGGKMAEGEAPKGSKGLIRWIIIGVVGLVVVVGGAVGGWLAYSKFFAHAPADAKAAARAPAAESEPDGALEHPQYLNLGSFVVNLADGRRYLKTTMQILISEEGAKTFLSTRLSEVQDLALSELQALTAESLRDPRTREDLKQRILTRIESLLPAQPKTWKDPRPVKKLLITEFYLQ